MGKIIVNRKRQWNNRLRQIGIYVDGQKIGTIANGEIKTFEIPDGDHSIEAKIDWCSSRPVSFSVSSQEKKYFMLTGYKLARFIFPYAFTVLIANFILNLMHQSNFVIWFFLPAFLIMLYYLTIGRKDYLVLKQTDTW